MKTGSGMDRNQNEKTIHLELHEEELDFVVCGLEYAVQCHTEMSDDAVKCVQDVIEKLRSYSRPA